MSEPGYTGGRLRAYLQFLGAILYFFLARSLAFHGARGLAGDAWFPLVGTGHAGRFCCCWALRPWASGSIAKSGPSASRDCRAVEGWPREAGLGLATGWGVALVCVLPLAVFGGIAIVCLHAAFFMGLAGCRCGIFYAGRAG